MKATVYMRVAKTARGFKYAATGKPSRVPLMNGDEPLPTVAFALVLALPADAFTVPVVAEIELTSDRLTPVVAVEREGVRA